MLRLEVPCVFLLSSTPLPSSDSLAWGISPLIRLSYNYILKMYCVLRNGLLSYTQVAWNRPYMECNAVLNLPYCMHGTLWNGMLPYTLHITCMEPYGMQCCPIPSILHTFYMECKAALYLPLHAWNLPYMECNAALYLPHLEDAH